MKRIFTAVCALALLMAGCTPALAAEAPELSAPPTQEPERSCYYPVKVEEYTSGPLDELRIDKVYQLSLGDDPSGIPTEDFTRNGRLYYLLDMVRKDEVGVDTQTHTETVTLASDTDKMDAILQRLDAEMEFTTEDGYTGLLRLDHTSVQVTTDGCASKTTSLSATRTYPNLSEADVSLIPKSISDKGRTLNLADVQWSSAESTDGEGGVVTHYTATTRIKLHPALSKSFAPSKADNTSPEIGKVYLILFMGHVPFCHVSLGWSWTSATNISMSLRLSAASITSNSSPKAPSIL